MPKASEILFLLCHPTQLRSIIQWKLWHDPVHRRNSDEETATEKSCYHFLNMTSRSFAAVIQELHPELLLPVCLFYLVLRGLDTIEDDMTIDVKKKENLLRNFSTHMETDGWTFTENGPNEKDRELLVHFDDVIVELKKMKRPYYEIIKDITIKMGNGMADYALNAEFNTNGVDSIKDYELYCHYVAGLVGDGLTRLFVEAKLANPVLITRPELMESMGQFLQKTNIIRDIHEDFLDKRRFWPKEIWSKHVDKFEDLFKPQYLTQALHCSSEMVLNALQHIDECLLYMAGIKEQSVFNFVAIPQSMAIATLELVFNNPDVFKRNIKITKGDACRLMMQSTQNLRVITDVFRDYTRRIHKKNDPRDPNYLEISIQCAKIEMFIESIFPSQTAKDAKANLKTGKIEQTPEQKLDSSETTMLILAVLSVLLVVGGLMVGTAWLMGARFDNVYNDVMGVTRSLSSSVPSVTQVHEEL